MNALVPFAYHGLQTTEALFIQGPFAPARRFRMTRKGWGEFFGAQNPQTYIDILKFRHAELPDGVTFTVKATDGKEYSTFTLDCIEAHAYAVWSELPNAKQYLLIFPQFLEAVAAGRLQLPDRSIAEIAAIPARTRGRQEAMKALAAKEGKQWHSVYRRVKKVEAGILLKKAFRPRDRGKYQEAKALFLGNPGQQKRAFARSVGVSETTLYNWIHHFYEESE